MALLPQRLPYKFIGFSLLIAALILVLENINHRFWLNDFRVYYDAATALRTGHQVYGLPFGESTGYYKYSPFALLFFLPYSVLPYYAACIIHFAVISICFVTAVVVCRQLVSTYILPVAVKNENLLLIIVEVCVMGNLFRELHLGNINVILILILCLSIWLLLKEQPVLAGVLLGIAIMFKPYLLLPVLALLLYKKFKTIIWIAVTICIAMLLPVIVAGFTGNIQLHKDWLNAMMAHNSYLYSNNTISSIISVPSSAMVIIGIILLAYILLWLLFIKAPRSTTQFLFEFFMLLAIIPNLLITDTEQFLFSLPLIVILLSYCWVERNYLIISLFTIAILLYSLQSADLVGRGAASWLELHGMLGISNLCLIGLTLYYYLRNRRTAL